jgi:hypothetical protein
VFPEWLELKDFIIEDYKKRTTSNQSTTDQVLPDQHHPVIATIQDQHFWVRATCAILTEMNLRSHNMLGGRNINRTSDVANAKHILANSWNIHSRNDLFKTLNWLVTIGHRDSFKRLNRFLAGLSENDILFLRQKFKSKSQMLNRIEIVLKYGNEVGDKSLLGWDYSRYVSLCGWGYIGGFMSEQEVWTQLMPVARSLQQRFDSWEDLGKNYIIGRQYWSKHQTELQGKRINNIYIKLLSSTDSPWVKLNWKLNLCPSNLGIEACSSEIPLLVISNSNNETKNKILHSEKKVKQISITN